MKFPDTRTQHVVLSFLAIVVFFQAMGGLMGWITSQGVDDWYQGLQRSPLNPPDYWFGIVWTLLYILLSVAFWRIWILPSSKQRTTILSLFTVHMLINWAWSPLFFIAHQVAASVMVIGVMIFTAAMLAWLIYPVSRWAAAVFAPYILWLTFAGYLSHYILMHN